MENPKINQIVDIRQSLQWGEYLKSLGWKKHSFGDYKNLYSLRAGPLTVSKIQRPVLLTNDDLVELDKVSRAFKLSFVKLEPSLQQNHEELIQAEFISSLSPLCPPSTIFIDLENDEDILHRNLSKTARYSINRSKREGGRVEVISKPGTDLLSLVYPTLRDTAKLQKFYVPSIEDLKVKLDLWKSEFHLAIVKNANGVLCGTNIFLGFNGNVWHIHGGTTAEGRKTKLGYQLLWESILHLKTLGYKLLDLEGKDDKRFPSFTKTWGGFSYFKEKFGGIEVEFPYPQIKYYNKALKFLSGIYKSSTPL